MSPPASTPIRSTRPGPRRGSQTSTYTSLLAEVKARGLLKRRTGFYWTLFGILAGCLVAAWIVFALLGDTWFQLIVAGALGVLFTQFAFISHEAAHRQVFASQRWNDRTGRYVGTFLVGLSYSWWMNKHTRHHGNPNTVDKDPDIAPDTIRFLERDAAAVRGPMRWFTRVQGWMFFPLLTLEGLNLHRLAVQSVLTGANTKAGRRERLLEGGLLLARFAIYLTVVFWALPFGMACAFLGVQLAVFGFMMGASFAPNHTGMPVIAHDAKVDFLARQVLTSRNISGGFLISFLMGGLDRQVEHHLFPSMPRPALKHARQLVREHCRVHDVPYTEMSIGRALADVVRYLNRVGLAARGPFVCPMVAQLR